MEMEDLAALLAERKRTLKVWEAAQLATSAAAEHWAFCDAEPLYAMGRRQALAKLKAAARQQHVAAAAHNAAFNAWYTAWNAAGCPRAVAS